MKVGIKLEEVVNLGVIACRCQNQEPETEKNNEIMLERYAHKNGEMTEVEGSNVVSNSMLLPGCCRTHNTRQYLRSNRDHVVVADRDWAGRLIVE